MTLACIALVGAYSLTRIDLTNSITHFMPSQADAHIFSLSLELVESPLSRRMVLVIDGGPSSVAVAADLADALSEHPEVEWVEAGLDEGDLREFYETFFARRFLLASPIPEVEIPALTAPSALRTRATDLKRRMTQPDGMLVARSAAADPLGLAERILARITASRPNTRGDDPATNDFATIQLGLVHSPFDSKRQIPLLAHIDSEFRRLERKYGADGLRLDQNGVNRFAVAAERSIRGDVNLISSVSMIVVVGLFLFVFRSIRQLGIAFLVPFGGFVFAMAVAVSGDRAVHGITLGFGFALIGVAIDYPIHLLNHHALKGGRNARATRDAIRKSLLLSGATTTLAFTSLTLSDFPGLGEIGRFGAIGVVVALLLTLLCLPAFMTKPAKASSIQHALARGFDRMVDTLAARRGLALAILAGFATIAGFGGPRLVWEDDPASLMATDPALVAEADRVRARVAGFEGARFVVALADDEQAVLELNSAIARRLRALVKEGVLEGIGSLDAFLWPVSLQRANRKAFDREVDLAARVSREFGIAGFRSEAFAPFEAALSKGDIEPLRAADLAATPLSRVLDAMVEIDGRYAVVTFLRGVSNGASIEGALVDLPGAYYIDRRAIIADLYTGYRASTIRRVAFGATLVFAVLVLWYRSVVRGLLAFVPAGLGAACTMGAFGLAGVPVNVASSVSLLVILGMGVDYGVFAVDSANRAGRVGPTLSSLLISCVTSIFVFGVLALSEQPVLRSIGLTTGVGVLFALGASPSAIALARPRSGIPE